MSWADKGSLSLAPASGTHSGYREVPGSRLPKAGLSGGQCDLLLFFLILCYKVTITPGVSFISCPLPLSSSQSRILEYKVIRA